jgi:hypothetical protein
MSASKKKNSHADVPKKQPILPPTHGGGKRAPLNATYFRYFPYVLIVGAVGVFYWPIVSAQGWLWNDFPEQNFVYRLFAAVSLHQGVFPFWNPYVFSGMPFFADVQAAVLYPLNLLLTPFAGADWLSPLLVEYQIVLHIVFGGIFMFWLCRDFRCSRSASLIGAVTFMFCGFCTTHIFHTNLVLTAVWFPLIVMLFRRMLERQSLIYLGLCALALASAFLAGYPQLMLHFYYWLGAYALFSIFIRPIEKKTTLRTKGIQASLFVALVALSVGTTSVQLLPTNELGNNSARPSLEFKASCEGSLHPYRLVTLLVPKFFGTPNEAYWGIGANDVRPGVHTYWETAAYCGILPLLLALFAAFFVRTPMTLFLSIVAGISLLLSMGDSAGLYKLAYTFMPGMDRFRVPGRFAFMLSFSVSILAAFGLQKLMSLDWRDDEKKRKLLVRIAVGISVAAVVGALAVSSGMLKDWVSSFMHSSGAFGADGRSIANYVEQTVYPALCGAWWTFALLAVASGALLVLRFTGRISARTTAMAAFAVVVVDMLVYGYGYASSPSSPDDMYRKTPLVSELQDQLRNGFFRVNSRDSKPGTTDLGGPHMAFQKNQGSVHRLFLMEGYNPLRLRHEIAERNPHALDILNVKYAIQVDEATGSMGLAPNPTYFPRARMVYRYSVVADDSLIPPMLWSSTFDHRGTVLLEKPLSMASYDGTDTIPWRADITSYGLNELSLSVETKRDGLLVLSEIHYPCWKATVDGKPAPLVRADYALRAILVPAGSHSVRCYYDDAMFRKGGVISIVSLAALFTIMGVGLLMAKRKKNAPQEQVA